MVGLHAASGLGLGWGRAGDRRQSSPRPSSKRRPGATQGHLPGGDPAGIRRTHLPRPHGEPDGVYACSAPPVMILLAKRTTRSPRMLGLGLSRRTGDRPTGRDRYRQHQLSAPHAGRSAGFFLLRPEILGGAIPGKNRDPVVADVAASFVRACPRRPHRKVARSAHGKQTLGPDHCRGRCRKPAIEGRSQIIDRRVRIDLCLPAR